MAKQKSKPIKIQKNIKKRELFTDPLIIIIFFFLTMILFRGIFSANQMIFSTDYSLWGARMYKDTLLSGEWQKWLATVFAGIDYQALFLYPSLIFLLLFPLHFYVGWMFAMNVFLAGAFAYCLFRYLKIQPIPACIAALGFMFTNHIVGFVYGGHMGKMGLFIWTPLLFLFYTKAIRERKFIYFAIAGIFYGIQFLSGEIQIAYYLGLTLVAWTLYMIYFEYRDGNKNIQSYGKIFIGGLLTVIISVLLSAQVFQYFLGLSMPGQGVPAGARDPVSQYEFATSWSFPPEEIITFFMKRPFGDMTGDPVNPYWGRIGSREMTLKLNDDYIGVIPLLLALAGLIFVERRKTLFWLLLALVTLIFAFGGYTPVYQWVYKFPAMSHFRVPGKWLFITVFSVSILSAYGAYAIYNRNNLLINKSKIFWFQIILIAFCVLALLTTIIGDLFSSNIVGKITNNLQNRDIFIDYSTVFARYRGVISSLWRMNLYLWLGAILILACLKLKEWLKYRNYLFAAIGLLIVVDLWSAGSFFIRYFPFREFYTPHPVTRFIMQDKEIPRIKIGQADGLLHNLAQRQFRYHQLLVWDTAASRLPLHYSRFIEEIKSNDFFKFMDVVSIKYLLTSQPFMDPRFQQVFSDSGIYVFQYLNHVPRIYGISRFEVFNTEEEVLKNMAEQEFNPREILYLTEYPNIPNSAEAYYTTEGFEFIRYSNNVVEISAKTERDMFLVLTDYYFPHWRAYINNQETPIYRANYLVRAIYLPKGEHQVKFVYSPPMIGFYITLFSWLVIIGVLIYYGVRYYKLKKVQL